MLGLEAVPLIKWPSVPRARIVQGAGKAVQAEQAAGKAVTGAAVEQKIANASSSVQETAKSVKQWLGKGSRMIINDNGDLVLMSKDGLRKMRFDVKNPHGYPPHMHLEVFKNGGWRNAIPGTHHLYPKQ